MVLSIQLLKELLYPFHLTYNLSRLPFITFSILKSFFRFFFFFQFFFVKSSNNFFSVKIINKMCPRYSVFNFFNHKKFFKPILYLIFFIKIFCIRSFFIRVFFIRIFSIKIKLNFYVNCKIHRHLFIFNKIFTFF